MAESFYDWAALFSGQAVGLEHTVNLGFFFVGHFNNFAFFALTFLLFRLFDILKPWPISAAERLPGGLGVMADDMLAGLAAAIIAAAVQYTRVI